MCVCVCACDHASEWVSVHNTSNPAMAYFYRKHKKPIFPGAMPETKHCCIYGEHTERIPVHPRRHKGALTLFSPTAGASWWMPGECCQRVFADLSLPSKTRLAGNQEQDNLLDKRCRDDLDICTCLSVMRRFDPRAWREAKSGLGCCVKESGPSSAQRCLRLRLEMNNLEGTLSQTCQYFKIWYGYRGWAAPSKLCMQKTH